ncbi:hypothetical protein GCM10009773_23140 [Williamsia serinedens]
MTCAWVRSPSPTSPYACCFNAAYAAIPAFMGNSAESCTIASGFGRMVTLRSFGALAFRSTTARGSRS